MTRDRTEEQKLITDIGKNRKNGKVSFATLRTDDRVLARITDGIYRQPASALRELISNAYDADATRVVIHTDAPRFNQITVRDDGNGMDVRALARLIHHIGGSAKRRGEGVPLGVTNKRDSSLSPKGRRLIGKIGIGLFSVSQLTRHFQIVTKVKGQDYRLVAEVILRTYAEDQPNKAPTGQKIDTGTVRIVSVPADDRSVQGTEITLMDLRPQARELLQSKEMWDIAAARPADPLGVLSSVREPTYHIGRISPSSPSTITRQPHLPWSENDKPGERFHKMYQAIIDEIGSVERNPRLETALDNYLRMLWTLSLAAPINYIDKHPFELTADDGLDLFQFTQTTGQAASLKLRGGETIRHKISFRAPERGGDLLFQVLVDDVELLRPIRFRDLPETSQALKKPLLFVGRAAPDLSGISTEERGGDLEFEAYFLWAPKIVPKENNGLLIRINDASGTLFDETFAKYQISELTRLKQITAEIFVLKGLDPALNIDRESFNYSHPHYLYIMRWVHRALRQLTNTHKQIAADLRDQSRHGQQVAQEKILERIVNEEVVRATRDPEGKPTEIEFGRKNPTEMAVARKGGQLALNADKVFAHRAVGKRSTSKNKGQARLFERQIKAVAQVLDAYGLMDGLTYEQQEELLHAIVAIFSVDKGA